MCFFKGISPLKKSEIEVGSPVKPVTEDTSSEMLAESEFYSVPDKKSKSSLK